MNADKELLLHVLSGGRVLEDILQAIADDGLSRTRMISLHTSVCIG